MTYLRLPAGARALTALVACLATTAQAETADLVITNGRIITMDAERSRASAIATNDGNIIYVGDATGLEAFIGPETEVIDAEGQIVLPGLHDVHIHPLFTVSPKYNGERYDCNFYGESIDLDATVAKLKTCLAEAELNEGGWLIGQAFNPPSLLSTTDTYENVRAALDAVSTEVPISLEGSDGHAFGLNSVAYTKALHPDSNQIVAITAQSLASDYAAYAEYFNTDENGEPDGTAKEFARVIINAPVAGLENFKPVLGELRDLMASNGITSVQDAIITEHLADVYAYMETQGLLDFRLRMNTHIDSNVYGGRTRPLDIDAAMAAAKATQARFADSAYIKGDGIKLFVDGVVEFPTQTAAMLNPYLVPITDADLNILGYVDLDGSLCAAVRTDRAAYEDAAKAQAFVAEHGFAPDRCEKHYGLLEFTPEELTRAVTAFDSEGFTVHMHALGDRAVREALNAIEAARNTNGESGLPHNLAHIQFVNPEDVVRIGDMGVVVTPTYSWAVPFWEYDTTVIPFINEVKSLFDMNELYHPNGRYNALIYPFRSIKEAGGILAAGSDAPVDQPTPQPFVNIAAGLIRADLLPIDPTTKDENAEVTVVSVNAEEVLALNDLLEAYTINGAIAMGQQDQTGSLEVGKKADLIMINLDIEELSKNVETIWDIAGTQVLLTVFDGRVVWDKR